jgi:putative membrane protein
MRYAVLPTALLVLIVSCFPGNQRSSETGMAEGGAGGLSTRDTMPSTVDTMSFTRADSTGGTEAASAPAAILSEMNVANTTEVQLSTLAAKKARSPKVRQTAHKLAGDHAKNREEVRALAQKLNATLTPGQGGSVSAADGAMPPDLRGKSGRDFDRAFIEHEINDHQSSIQRLQTQAIPSVQNADIKAYLQKTLKEMQSHLSMLKQVRKQLGS